MLPHQNPHPPKWYHTVWGVIVLLFIFGPFAFPFLWKSSLFSTFWKWVVTVVFTLLTISVTMHCIEIVRKTIEEYRAAGLMP